MWLKTRPNIDPDGGHSDGRYYLMNSDHIQRIYIANYGGEYPYIEVEGPRVTGIFYPHPDVPEKYRHEICKRIMDYIEHCISTKPPNFVCNLYNYRNDYECIPSDKGGMDVDN